MRIPIVTILDRSYLVWESRYTANPGSVLLRGDEAIGPILTTLLDECPDTIIESERFGEGELGDLHERFATVVWDRMSALAVQNKRYDELSQHVYDHVATAECKRDLVTATLASLVGLPFHADGVIDYVDLVGSDLRIEYRTKGDAWLVFQAGFELRDKMAEHIARNVCVENWYAHSPKPPEAIGVLFDDGIGSRANPFR